MKNKELKNLAKKIAEAEYIVQTSSDKKVVHDAEAKIMELSGKVSSLDDMIRIDEMVQEILKEKI